jgi:SAM-dependent methyltransferase
MGRHQAAREPDPVTRVRSYYEKNTRLFLALGIGRRTLAIRRAVWAEGVETLPQAVDYVNGLIAGEALKCPVPGGHDGMRILDIGCGVGGSLFSLSAMLGKTFHGVGVTISPLQAHIASVEAQRRHLAERCVFIAGDFASLPSMEPFCLAFAIESYVHFSSPDSFFAGAAASLPRGGRLVIVDDFLSKERHEPREDLVVRAFREGWILPSLGTAAAAARAGARHGFHLVENRDLSPHLLPPHPLVGRWTVRLMRALPVPSFYWQSTTGSIALSLCQREGLTEYRFLVFEKREGVKSGDG